MTVPAHRLHNLVLLLATSAMVAVSGCSRTPADDSVEAGFARDMATHHAQAVEMAFIIRDVTTDDALRALSEDIIVTQSAQRGMFMAWLQQWRLPQAAAGPRMAWMESDGASHAAAGMQHATAGHGVTAMPLMAGMATDGEMDTLRSATGREAEVLFLQLMIRHHEGGVIMAKALLDRSTLEHVVTLARGIDSGQTGEIASMTQMLRARDAQPLPSLLLPQAG
jgi:uncharacterized protein (DUF305 family)